MAHRDVFTLSSWCCFHLSSFFPTVGKAAGNLALPVQTRRQAKKATWLGMHTRTMGRRGNMWKSRNLNQQQYVPPVVASKKSGSSVTHVMAREKGLMDIPVAHAGDTEDGTKSVPRVAARAGFLLNRR